MDRREFLTKSGVAAGLGIAGGTGISKAVGARGRVQFSDLPDIEWEMPTSWPLNLDTIFGGAEVFAEEVGAAHRRQVRDLAEAGGELVPGTESSRRCSRAPTRSATRRRTTTSGWRPGRRSARRCRSDSTPASRTRGSTKAAGSSCCRALRPLLRRHPVPGRQHRLPDGRLVPRRRSAPSTTWRG